MEEKFGKSVRTPYIVSYAIMIAISLFIAFAGVLITLAVAESLFMGLFLIIMGVILLGASIAWLVYFIRMPVLSITYKDGKLNFRNKLECTPDRIENIESRTLGLDGAIFGFGKIFVTVDGEKYKFNFIANQQEVVNRLYAIRNEYVAAQNAAYFAAQAQAQEQAAQSEAAPAVESVAVAEETVQEAVVEQNNTTGTEENNG